MIPEIQGLESVRPFQDNMAGKTVEWWSEDTPERFDMLSNDPSQRRLLEKNGWLTTPITYTFNSQGFRGHDFDPQQEHFCVFGDSVTFGEALNHSQTYGGVLESRLGIKCYNFGQSGGSNDTAVRNAMIYLKNLKPRFVIFQTTFDHRFEWIFPGNVAQNCGVHSPTGDQWTPVRGDLFTMWVNVDMNRFINRAKNIMCFRFICDQLSIPLIEIDITKFFSPPDDRARDLMHPGPKIHRRNADRMMGQLSKLNLL